MFKAGEAANAHKLSQKLAGLFEKECRGGETGEE